MHHLQFQSLSPGTPSIPGNFYFPVEEFPVVFGLSVPSTRVRPEVVIEGHPGGSVHEKSRSRKSRESLT